MKYPKPKNQQSQIYKDLQHSMAVGCGCFCIIAGGLFVSGILLISLILI